MFSGGADSAPPLPNICSDGFHLAAGFSAKWFYTLSQKCFAWRSSLSSIGWGILKNNFK